MIRSAILPFLFTLAPTLTAQAAVVRGELADGRATGCYYCPGYQYVIKWVGTRIESSTVNLAAFLGQQVEFTGDWDGTIFHVTAAQVVPTSFDLIGNGSIGNRYRCNAQGAPGEVALNAISLGTMFTIPLPTVAALLHPATTVVMGIGTVSTNGEFKSDVDIPDNPALIGLRINGQAFFASTAAGPFRSSNLDSKVVNA
jgi:hypothetical protein